MTRASLYFLAALVVATAAHTATAEAVALPDYLSAENPAFSWRTLDVKKGEGYTVHDCELISQNWRGMEWKHWLTVILPDELSKTRGKTGLLYIDGGDNDETPPTRLYRQAKFFGEQAKATGTTLSVIRQVPNQPLFKGLKEDALIAYTFDKFLATGDPSWPCLMPMTRSAMSAMDAIEELTEAELGTRVNRFVVTGASKRGWTSWLTAAADERVCAVAPMVIDTLNMPEQMKLQMEAFGRYSLKIKDYTERNLQSRVDEPLGNQLVSLVDPYTQRDRITAPKLLIVGTNDPYWPVDAAKLYFGDLSGEKYIHYMPNTGHAPGPSALEAIAGFYGMVVDDKPRPRFEWNASEAAGEFVLELTTQDVPVTVELWQATSADRDFRDDEFSSTTIAGDGKSYRTALPLPDDGFTAAFLSITYSNGNGGTFKLCTTVEIFGESLFF